MKSIELTKGRLFVKPDKTSFLEEVSFEADIWSQSQTHSVVLKITDINGKIFCFRLSVQIILFGNWTFSARTYEFCHVSFSVHTFYQMHVSLRLNFSENIAASGWHWRNTLITANSWHEIMLCNTDKLRHELWGLVSD